jgi:CheY-like chemotaxis protein
MADILIIDDDDALRSTMRKLLERVGHAVREAADGASGLALLKQSRPDLVVTDLYMPEKEGIETILEVRAVHPDLPILAVSGGGIASPGATLGDAEALGASATLAKPFSVEDFQETIERLLA